MENFRHETGFTVRFEDLDALGHVNHAKYLIYMEHARIEYMRDVLQFSGDWSALGMILARAEVDYLAPIQFNDVIKVYTRIMRIGGKSFDMEYIIVRVDAQIETSVAKGVTVMVKYDYLNHQTEVIPDNWRERITAYESELST